MKSTKDTIKHFIVLSVRRSDGRSGELQRFEYQDGDRFLTRKAAIRHAETARMRWANNYAQYRDASFSLADTADLPSPAPKVTRKQYDRLQDAGIAPVDNSYASVAPGYRPKLNAYSAASIMGRR